MLLHCTQKTGERKCCAMKDQYAIIGLAKLHTAGNIAGVMAHMYRTRPTENSNGQPVDVRIRPKNIRAVMDNINQYCPRKNAVLAYDFLVAASPEWFIGKSPAEIEAWKQDSQKWLEDTFGKESLIGLVWHDRDETSCHGQALILPIYQDALNAKHYTGDRGKMRGLWSSYAKAMAKYGLKRGKMYSPAKHESIREYYARVNASETVAAVTKVREEQLPAPTMGDRVNPKSYAAGLLNHALEWYRKENAALHEELAAERNKREQITRQVTKDRELFAFLQAEPGAYKALAQELEAERAAHGKDKERFTELVAAVAEFFKRNIDKNSVYRSHERLGKLAKFPELEKAVRLSLQMKESARGSVTLSK